jgi:hypothetical protein
MKRRKAPPVSGGVERLPPDLHVAERIAGEVAEGLVVVAGDADALGAL